MRKRGEKTINRRLKSGLVALALIALAALLYVAASENLFFGTITIVYEDTAESEVGLEDGLSFYAYKDSYGEYKLKVATLSLDVERVNDDLAHVKVEVAPEENYRLNWLELKIGIVLPLSALVLGDPQSGQPPSFDYVRTDDAAFVTLNFPEMDFKAGEVTKVDFWLDLLQMEPSFEERLTLDTSFSMHELSVFKIIKLDTRLIVRIIVP